MLRQEQIEQFMRDGVLIIPGFFEASEIADWRAQAMAYFDHPVSAAQWVDALLGKPTTTFRLRREPLPATHGRMAVLYACFNGVTPWHGENELVARAPEPAAEWLGARTPHLDFPVYDQIRTLANTVFYLSDVGATGAPFMYWPGSHHVAWNYFGEHPQDYMTRGELSQDQIFARITARMTVDPVSFAARAGDLLVWNSLLLHSPSVNLSESPRLAVIGRWGQRLAPSESHFDFDGDRWRHWHFRHASDSVGPARTSVDRHPRHAGLHPSPG